jgi:hypothetical protein
MRKDNILYIQKGGFGVKPSFSTPLCIINFFPPFPTQVLIIYFFVYIHLSEYFVTLVLVMARVNVHRVYVQRASNK